MGYPYHFTLNFKTASNTEDSSEQSIARKPYSDVYIGFPIDCFYEAKRKGPDWITSFEINLEKMPGYRGQSALAISIVRNFKTSAGEIQDSWSGENPHIRPRLCLHNYNPEAMGRLELN